MEEYYIKRGRRYVKAGWSMPSMAEGLYWRQKTEYGTRTTSVMHWAGSTPPQPLDVQKLISVMSNDDKLANYIVALTDETSEQYKKAKEDQGGYINKPLRFYNWSAQDLATCILRFVFEQMAKDKNILESYKSD
jgi:hypothetical protein